MLPRFLIHEDLLWISIFIYRYVKKQKDQPSGAGLEVLEGEKPNTVPVKNQPPEIYMIGMPESTD